MARNFWRTHRIHLAASEYGREAPKFFSYKNDYAGREAPRYSNKKQDPQREAP
jgi:hypothetical protein